MAGEVLNYRYTAEMQEPFVLFLIGTRVNKLRYFPKWGWVSQAFGNMTSVLRQHPEKGFLSGETFVRFFPLEVVMISYWRSFDDLERFARDQNDPHLAPWRDFYRRIGTDGSIGIWHETYRIEPQHQEGIYVNMPLFGLAKATGTPIEIKGGYRNKARARMAGHETALDADLEISDL